MSLKNLNQIGIDSQQSFLKYNKEEIKLSRDFKSLFTEIIQKNSKESVSFSEYTTIVRTSKGLTITFPNQWFYIASFFVDYLKSLKEYKEHFHKALDNISKDSLAEIKKTQEIPSEIKEKIDTYFTTENDVANFTKFLSDYDWWFGSKTIDRGDYFVSPILSLAKVVNVSQGYISHLAYLLSENSQLLSYLTQSEVSKNIPKKISDIDDTKKIDFNLKTFVEDSKKSGLTYSYQLINRYISSLATKPFVLLSGLSGSGKTKLAQSFAQWICEDNTQYCIVPVGADWTNREPLLGYVNALNNNEYILPENGVLNLIIEANKEDNQIKPYFLILDEMNLSHVERYFADFLSIMESKDKFKLHSSKNNLNITGDENSKSIEVPSSLNWPKNLFVIGTVNIDETTYMFSPKVLDRANAIEFRVSETEIKEFLDTPKEIDLTQLEYRGAIMAASFIEISKNKEFETIDTTSLNKTLVNFFSELKKTGAEFGYRTGIEIHRLYQQLSVVDKEVSENEKIDIAVIQKLLPKLHGSRRKLCPILETLAKLCIKGGDAKKDFLENNEILVFKENTNVIYPLSLEKITRMYKGAIDNGFASYAEA